MARYWVGGTGNWSDDTNHWATTSGGTPGAGNLPTSADDVFFDSASHTTSYTVTIDATTKICRDLTFSAPASGDVTWAGTVLIQIYGSLTLYSGLIRNYTGNLTFLATTTGKTITLAGKTMNSLFTFNGAGGRWSLQDELNNSAKNIAVTRGTFNTNNQTVSCDSLLSNNSNLRAIQLGSSTINLSGGVDFTTSTNLTFDCGTSTIKPTASSQTHFLGGQTYYIFWMAQPASSGGQSIFGSNTFTELKYNQGVPFTVYFEAGTTQTIGTWSINGTAGNEVIINSSSTATHALVKSGGGTVNANYLNIQHSVATPSSTWYATNSTDNQAVATAGSGWNFSTATNTGAGFFAFASKF